ncbi:MAG TPA: protease pro-enzyme activation domain-containing protein [Candidatus Baltobacteraceae bacterium]|nr:protease pro-enzyme activation domain-containing protein [Candidatus Baltobacteraceae bacterium]
MRTSIRAVASLLVMGMALSACGGHGSSVVPSTPQSSGSNALGPQIKQIATPPRTAGIFAFTDRGERDANAPTPVTITLQYNHQAELDQLVLDQSNPASPKYHQYLTTQQFNSYYAPTAEQEAQVVAQLKAQGFTITKQFENRTIIDAVAPTSAVERTFHTHIHTATQGRFGTRFVNTEAAELPESMVGLVRDVTLNNLVVAHPMQSQARRHATHSSLSVPGALERRPMAIAPYANVVSNPGFETGTFSGWSFCGTSNMNPTVSTNHPHTGLYSGRMGSTNSNAGEPNGDSGICQQVTIPASGTLSFWVYQISTETNTSFAWQEADLLDSAGNRVVNFYTTVNNVAGWVQKSYNLSSYAGNTYWLYFGVHGDGYPYTYTWQYVDDVSLSGTTSTPTPAPTSTPAPTPTPVPTSTPSGNCTGAAALNGPLSGTNGWLATGVAKAFDFPVQHGCNGSGQTVAVEIDTPITSSDVTTYLNAAGVSRTGTITNVAVDGGGSATSSDYVETALDVETIAGLAPGANIRVYNFPDLSSQHIEDGYNAAVNDGIATVVNSSFGGCETSDTAFTNTTNSIAQQAAAKGMTFAASSGDSGSAECGTGSLGVSAPASDPYFTAVGAVNFTSNSTTGALTSITAGSDSANGFQSGGGYSSIFAVPSYQSGVSGVNPKGRNNPDVSLPGVGVAVYAASQGGWLKVDGTSWSSPEFTALMSEINQYRNTHYGFVNPNLYTVFKNTGYTDYTDVTSGTNGAYNAATGYDLVTGIGAPKGWALAGAL